LQSYGAIAQLVSGEVTGSGNGRGWDGTGREGRTAVYDIALVEVRDGADDLVDEAGGITLRIGLELDDFVEEFASLDPENKRRRR
jgi:hypothetical protein